MANFYGGQHQFNISNVEINYIQRPSDRDPFQILCKARAIEATEISNVAAYAPKCSPGSRTKTLTDIMAWVDAPTSAILWISGIAGAGKTCVMREVVNRCREAGLVTWTYFFNFRHPRLIIEQPFVATLVSQMIVTIPQLRPFVLQSIDEDPDIFNVNASQDHQMKTLLIPALDLPPFQADPAAPSKIAILVDAIDECKEKRERGNLLRLLHSLTQRKRPTVIVIVASRPEPDLRTAYEAPVLKSATTHMRLEKYDTSTDVRHFLCDEFEKIRNTHPMYVPEEWPDEDTLSKVENFCSGEQSLLLASTIARFVESPKYAPVNRLNEVLSLGTSRSATQEEPFAPLDSIYDLILHPPASDSSFIRRLLYASTVVDSHGHDGVELESLDALFGVTPGTVSSIASELAPVVDQSQGRLVFRHKSLKDFLLSPERSKDLFRPRAETCLDVVTAISENLKNWYDDDRTVPHLTGCFVHHWASFAWESGVFRLPVEQIPAAITAFDPRMIFCYVFMAQFSDWSGGSAIPVSSSWGRLASAAHLRLVRDLNVSFQFLGPDLRSFLVPPWRRCGLRAPVQGAEAMSAVQ